MAGVRGRADGLEPFEGGVPAPPEQHRPTDWWLRVLPAGDGIDMADTARELADITVNFSDGLFVASQSDDDIDMPRRIGLIALGLQAIVTAMLAKPAEKAPKRRRAATPRPRSSRA